MSNLQLTYMSIHKDNQERSVHAMMHIREQNKPNIP